MLCVGFAGAVLPHGKPHFAAPFGNGLRITPLLYTPSCNPPPAISLFASSGITIGSTHSASAI